MKVAEHATPVGSGTVARTKRIPVQDRAKAAVLAWMRHHTTDLDHRVIANVRGRRREIRRELVQVSRGVLSRYRSGEPPQDDCVLQRALLQPERSTAVPVQPVAKRPPPTPAKRDERWPRIARLRPAPRADED